MAIHGNSARRVSRPVGVRRGPGSITVRPGGRVHSQRTAVRLVGNALRSTYVPAIPDLG